MTAARRAKAGEDCFVTPHNGKKNSPRGKSFTQPAKKDQRSSNCSSYGSRYGLLKLPCNNTSVSDVSNSLWSRYDITNIIAMDWVYSTVLVIWILSNLQCDGGLNNQTN